MRYVFKKTKVVKGGHADVNIKVFDSVCEISYVGEVKVSVGGLFSVGKDIQGNLRIKKKFLEESFLDNAKEFETNGLTFKKVKDDKFSFEGKGVNGTVTIGFDGLFPVEIKSIVVDAFGGISVVRA